MLLVVLTALLADVRSKEIARPVRGGVGDGVEFVVAKDDVRCARVHHRLHESYDADLLGSAVDQVADEDGSPVLVTVRSQGFSVSHRFEQPLQ